MMHCNAIEDGSSKRPAFWPTTPDVIEAKPAHRMLEIWEHPFQEVPAEARYHDLNVIDVAKCEGPALVEDKVREITVAGKRRLTQRQPVTLRQIEHLINCLASCCDVVVRQPDTVILDELGALPGRPKQTIPFSTLNEDGTNADCRYM